MNIDQAEMGQLDEIMTLIRSVARDMNARGFFQWGEDYPRKEMFKSHIEDKDLWILVENNIIIGTILITGKQDKEYLDVAWEDKSGMPVVIHRLAIHIDWQRKGLAKKLMDFAEDHARENGYTSVRLDTYNDNKRAREFYKARGYEYRGTIHFPQRDGPYFCFELKLQ